MFEYLKTFFSRSWYKRNILKYSISYVLFVSLMTFAYADKKSAANNEGHLYCNFNKTTL